MDKAKFTKDVFAEAKVLKENIGKIEGDKLPFLYSMMENYLYNLPVEHLEIIRKKINGIIKVKLEGKNGKKKTIID